MGKRSGKRRRQSSKSNQQNSNKKQCTITDFVVRPKNCNKSTDSVSNESSIEDQGENSDTDLVEEGSKESNFTDTMDKEASGNDELKDMIRTIMDKQDTLMRTVSTFEGRLSNIDHILGKYDQSIEFLHSEVRGMKTQIHRLENPIDNNIQTSQTSNFQKQISELSDHMNSLERKSREMNLRLIGYPEKPNEDCVDIVKYILYDRLNVDGYVEVAHRTGRPVLKNGYRMPRHLIFRVGSVQQKQEILQYQRQALQNEPYFITEDLTQKDLWTKRRLKPVIDQARQQGKRWKFRNGKLFIEGQLYNEPGMVGPSSIQAPVISGQAPESRQTYAMAVGGPVQLLGHQTPPVQLRHQTHPHPVTPIPATAAMRMPLAPPNLRPNVPLQVRTPTPNSQQNQLPVARTISPMQTLNQHYPGQVSKAHGTFSPVNQVPDKEWPHLSPQGAVNGINQNTVTHQQQGINFSPGQFQSSTPLNTSAQRYSSQNGTNVTVDQHAGIPGGTPIQPGPH